MQAGASTLTHPVSSSSPLLLLADPASDAWIPDLVAGAQAGRRVLMVYDGERADGERGER
jgi:hypothetical protein